jgi:hypothetical protein
MNRSTIRQIIVALGVTVGFLTVTAQAVRAGANLSNHSERPCAGGEQHAHPPGYGLQRRWPGRRAATNIASPAATPPVQYRCSPPASQLGSLQSNSSQPRRYL